MIEFDISSNMDPIEDILLYAKRNLQKAESEESIYEWIDKMLTKAKQLTGAVTTGKQIELKVYNSFNKRMQKYLASLKGNEPKSQVIRGLQEEIRLWQKEIEPETKAAFAELFKKGIQAAAISTGVAAVLGKADEAALKVLAMGPYRIGERISLFGDNEVKMFEKIIHKAYTKEGVFNLDFLTNEMNKAVPEEKWKLERIARTETASVSGLGRLFAWKQDPDKEFYIYKWSVAGDNRMKEISKLRASYGDLSFDEAEFLWLNQEQELPNGKWQNDIFNQRCVLVRIPSNEKKVGNRFIGIEDKFKRTF